MKEDTILGLLQADYGILCRTVCRESRYWVHCTVIVDEDKNITFDFDAESAMFRGSKDNRLISALKPRSGNRLGEACSTLIESFNFVSVKVFLRYFL